MRTPARRLVFDGSVDSCGSSCLACEAPANAISTRSLLHLWTLTLTTFPNHPGNLTTLALTDTTATLTNLRLTVNSIQSLIIGGKRASPPTLTRKHA